VHLRKWLFFSVLKESDYALIMNWIEVGFKAKNYASLVNVSELIQIIEREISGKVKSGIYSLSQTMQSLIPCLKGKLTTPFDQKLMLFMMHM
jgi:hypothetical protein